MGGRGLTLELLPGFLAVVRLESQAQVPEWALDGDFVSFTRTRQELSIICPDSQVPDSVKAQRGFRYLKVRGPLDFSQVGVLASLATPLASAGVSIFVISTYDTDYLMVPSSTLELAVSALTQAGHKVSA